jgi:hypothetical protein
MRTARFGGPFFIALHFAFRQTKEENLLLSLRLPQGKAPQFNPPGETALAG